MMANRGFTIKYQLKEINVELNIPPFLDEQQQLPADEVKRGSILAYSCQNQTIRHPSRELSTVYGPS